MKIRAKKGLPVDPVVVTARGRSAIADTFWGRMWCEALESQADFANRLPRGRTYVRNGSVVHLGIAPGVVEAFVQGSELYTVSVKVNALDAKRWSALRDACGQSIGSALDLLQGKLTDGAMKVLTRPGEGLLPRAGDFKMKCSCPDWATMCKHVAAVLYGVGARLDAKPELLFTLRGVAMEELVSTAATAVAGTKRSKDALATSSDALSDLFGIDLGDAAPLTASPAPKKTAAKKDTATAKVAAKEAESPAAAPKKTAPKKAAAPASKKAAAPAPKKTTARVAVSSATPSTRPAAASVSSKLAKAMGLAAGQELTTSDLRALGVGDAALKKLVVDKVLEKFGYGWYRVVAAG